MQEFIVNGITFLVESIADCISECARVKYPMWSLKYENNP